ncbi:hypothetical protein COLU111180_14685 [Cohnella lubricantis]|nr:hypothetical protein [Cohnella lubricantis]
MTTSLYHYFDKNIGAFKNLSSLSEEQALEVSNEIKKNANPHYMTYAASVE